MTTLEFLTDLRAKGVHIWAEGDKLRYRAPSGVITGDIRTELGVCKAKILELLRCAVDSSLDPIPIGRAHLTDGPLSFAEEGLWLLDQLRPGTHGWNMQTVLRLRGELNVAALERSINALIKRHDVLRTYFRANGENPIRAVVPEIIIQLPVLQLDTASSLDSQIDYQCEVDSFQPFDLSHAPLFRARLLKCNDIEHIWIFTQHHIIHDGWSSRIFSRELFALYQAFSTGQPSPLPALPCHYSDYAQWVRQKGEDIKNNHVSYWQKKLAGLTPTELPSEKARPQERSYNGDVQDTELSAAVGQALRQLCKNEQTTTFMLLVAAFKLLIQRHTGNADVAVGAVTAGRSQPEFESLLGMFADIVVLRSDLSAGQTFRQLLKQVRKTCLDAYQHQELGFDRVLSELNPVRLTDRNPYFQVLFDVVNLPFDEPVIDGLTIEKASVTEPIARYELTIRAPETRDKINLHITYSTDLFSRAYIVEVLEQYKYLIEQVVENPDRNLADYSLSTPSARRILPDPTEPLDDTWQGAVHEIFSRRATAHPEKIAVEDGHDLWTYAELEARSNQLARYLMAHGIGREDVVAIYGHRNASLVWALLGVLKTGAVLLIVDPAHPRQRLLDQLQEANPKGWIEIAAMSEAPANFPCAQNPPAGGCHVRLPSLAAARNAGFLAGYPAASPEVPIGPDDLAYVIFTSGSTAKPKGVLGRHGPLSHFLPWVKKEFELSESDRFSVLAALSSNILQREIFTGLCLGASIVLPPADNIGQFEKLGAWIHAKDVTVVHLTPGMSRLFEDSDPTIATAVRRVFFAGDLLTRADVHRTRRLMPHAMQISFYNSSESQRAGGYRVINLDPEAPGDDSQSLGKGIKDVQLLVLDKRDDLPGMGELGEICVRSPHLAKGYLGDHPLTAERFSVNPFSNVATDRIYRTRELGRYLPNGDVQFHARSENQVSIRGFRVDLREIESVLKSHAEALDAAVTLQHEPVGQLIAFVVPKTPESLPIQSVRSWLRARLPGYMVPSGFVVIDALPMTPTGKVDRQALRTLDTAGSKFKVDYVAPRSLTEETIAGIWSESLGVNQIGVHDNFFEFGGHSLKATQVVSQLRKTFYSEIPLRHLFDYPTVAELAAVIDSGKETEFGDERLDRVLSEIEALSEEETQDLLGEKRNG